MKDFHRAWNRSYLFLLLVVLSLQIDFIVK